MKKATLFCMLFVSFILISLLSCDNNFEADPNAYSQPYLPAQPFDYTDADLPFHLTFLDNTPTNNALTDAGATLGRVLFYDKKLSINNRTSCGSCHHQNLGFSDGEKTSPGFKFAETPRNSMAFANLRTEFGFFWDLRANTLEEQVLMPIQNHVEMGMEDLDLLTNKLKQFEYYPPLFEAAFGNAEITAEGISKGLSQFLRSIVSYNTKYDEGLDSDFANFTMVERRGLDLFFSQRLHCNSCHTGSNFSSYYRTSNIGLEMEYGDKGALDGHFKVPTLRNIALTAPYMHNGSIETLEEVIEHYNSGIVDHPSLDFQLKEGYPGSGGITGFPSTTDLGGPQRLQLTDSEKIALLAFLHTLTDKEMITDVKFSNPF